MQPTLWVMMPKQHFIPGWMGLIGFNIINPLAVSLSLGGMWDLSKHDVTPPCTRKVSLKAPSEKVFVNRCQLLLP
jgi:hypothetical protein